MLKRLDKLTLARSAALMAAVFLMLGWPLRAQISEDALKARQWMMEGRYGKAEDLLLEKSTNDPHELRLRLELERRRGRLQEADATARRLLGLLDLGGLSTPGELAQAAFAAWHLDRWRQANDIYLQAAELGEAPVSLYLDWGRLYLEKYNAAEAEDIFKEALELAEPDSKEAAAALAGLAQAHKTQSKPSAAQLVEQALAADPDNLHAIGLKAAWAISAASWQEAEQLIERGLGVNKNYLPLLEQEASMLYFRGESEKYEKRRDRILEINPNNADLYEALGEAAVLKRRMVEADGFFREAIRLNPRQWSALAALGLNLLRLGDDEGRRVLERAYENDPFNIWTVNTLRLVDSWERFAEFESEHFRIRLRKDEAEVLKPYVMSLLQRCLEELEEKYQHQIEGRYTFEMYPDHEDFAVRALGMPGLGALGVAIGRVVAMDSPSARQRGEFHWGSTLWHEVAHVVALSMSDQKVPRWFTEGLSMMEERLPFPGWGDAISLTYIEAYREGELLPLKDLNDGFQRPKNALQIQISYQQAGWLCEFLVERYGFAKIRQMLLAYADDKTDAEVFEQVLGKTLEQVDSEFQEAMAQQLDPLLEKLERPQQDSSQARVLMQADIGQLHESLADNPSNYFLLLRTGQRLIEEDRHQEAEELLQRAIEIFPSYSGAGSPYHLLADFYRTQGRSDDLAELLMRWWRVNPKRADTALELSRLLADKGEEEQAIEILEEAMYADPLRQDVHRLLAGLYLSRQEGELAEREYRVLLALEPTDMAGARYGLARALFLQEKLEESKRQVLLSLEIAPSYVEAQQLLLELVKP
ncbi:MAG TPA: hypothetical protein VLU25_15515 [Acidobacteriota bacterium]|nr:hypothetical protein [Acidobacteriota bacterium]